MKANTSKKQGVKQRLLSNVTEAGKRRRLFPAGANVDQGNKREVNRVDGGWEMTPPASVHSRRSVFSYKKEIRWG